MPRPGCRTARRATAVLVAVLALVLPACGSTDRPPSTPPGGSPTTGDPAGGRWTWTPQAGPLELGVTHTRDSLDPHHPDAAGDRGRAVLADDGAVWQNHHLMGFGTLNPEPSPGVFDWETLDRRMRLGEDTGGRAVLTLCCAPDWMKGGEAGRTDWSRLEVDPLPAHFEDFAALAAAAVQRYPQVERVLVWNELKGFYRTDLNRWDHEGYTDLYNAVYRAVKAVRPEVQVGGPYVVLSSLDPGSPDSSDVRGPWGVVDQRALDVVEYWLAHNVGADFVAVDASTKTRNGTRPTTVEVGAQKYAALDHWLRTRTALPVWWAEFYPDVPDGEQGGPTSPVSTAATLAAVGAFAETGAQAALLWGPQGHDIRFAALWTDSTVPDGGHPTPLTAAWQWLVPRLAANRIEIGRSPSRSVLVLRADDGAVTVNLTGSPVAADDAHPALPAWAVVISPRSS